jgi:hypothetical protein
MNRKNQTRIAAILMFLHGSMEILGLFALFAPPQFSAMTFENFGGMPKSDIAANLGSIVILGVMWGITRIVTAFGVLKMKKWAVAAGILVSVVSLIASISIIPSGVMDTLFAAPVLLLLLAAWFEKATLDA